MGDPQSLNRHTYTLNNPVKYRDPTGHYYCGDHYDPACLETDAEVKAYTRMEARRIQVKYNEIDDLEAMAQISDMYAAFYPDWDTFLSQMTWTFNGSETYGPSALVMAVVNNVLAAGKGNACDGVGRDPHDCRANDGLPHFRDIGFHPEFQDGHNQPYHAWGFIAQAVDFNWDPYNRESVHLGFAVGHFGNVVHELVQSALSSDPKKLGWGTSWQDYYLSHAGMEIGLAISLGGISAPSELGDILRYKLGPDGPGSNGAVSRTEQQWGPLTGSP
jgi:hypothetical protein